MRPNWRHNFITILCGIRVLGAHRKSDIDHCSTKTFTLISFELPMSDNWFTEDLKTLLCVSKASSSYVHTVLVKKQDVFINLFSYWNGVIAFELCQ